MYEENKLIWDGFLNDLKEKFKDYTPKLNHNDTLNVVIIEPRIIEDLITTCKTTLFFLNENNSHNKWGLQIFHGIENETWIKELTKTWGDITYTNINVKNFTHQAHSDYMETAGFWEKVKGEKVIILQSDSTLIRNGIEEFLNYDYIGAPWRKPKENSLVGNGGLSLRNVKKMLEICKNHPPAEPILEDIYFIKHLKGNGVADYETAKRFSMEDVYSENPLGVHKPIKHIEPQLLKNVLYKN